MWWRLMRCGDGACRSSPAAVPLEPAEHVHDAGGHQRGGGQPSAGDGQQRAVLHAGAAGLVGQRPHHPEQQHRRGDRRPEHDLDASGHGAHPPFLHMPIWETTGCTAAYTISPMITATTTPAPMTTGRRRRGCRSPERSTSGTISSAAKIARVAHKIPTTPTQSSTGYTHSSGQGGLVTSMPSIGAAPCAGGSSTASTVSTPTRTSPSTPSSARCRVNGRVGSGPVSLARSPKGEGGHAVAFDQQQVDGDREGEQRRQDRYVHHVQA